MDFTFEKYERLLASLKDIDNEILPVEKYLKKKPDSGFVILRHDVDRNPKKSLKIAKMETKLNVNSTYYFRYPHTFDKKIIRKIADLGHEIGYHYEVLSKADGDHDKAIELFRQEMDELREFTEIKTVCMHGSPASDYDNRDLWEFLDFEKQGLLGDAFFSVDDFDIYYFTDTGRRWDDKYNLRDKHEYKNVDDVKSTEEFMGLLERSDLDRLYITTHPERWGEGMVDCMFLWTKDFVFNMGKKVLQVRY